MKQLSAAQVHAHAGQPRVHALHATAVIDESDRQVARRQPLHQRPVAAIEGGIHLRVGILRQLERTVAAPRVVQRRQVAEGEDPDTAEAACEVACTACGRCVVDGAPGLIHLERNLAVIDYARNDKASRQAIERCPTGAIVWLEGDRIAKGKAAKKIIRIQPLPVAAEA